MGNPVKTLRLVGYAEAASYVALLAIAMPLKYLADLPLAVRVVGALHGLLFTLYAVAAVRAARARRWPLDRLFEALAAAIFPGGPIFLDGWLRREEAALDEAPTAGVDRLSPPERP